MRHRRRVKHFSRKSGPRKALVRGLVDALVEHGRISTTLEKAKEIKRHVEKAITLGKKGTLNSKRLLVSRYPNEETAHIIWSDLASRFKERKGGYTRVIKIGTRPGDAAEMAFLEFVDFDFTSKAAEKSPEDKKADAKALKLKANLIKLKKKSVRKMQVESRRFNRA
jgi:large subunit ribosomal protein L17